MKRVAILLEELFDERELIYPYFRLLEEGYQVDLVGSEKEKVYRGKTGLEEKSQYASGEIDPRDYDGVVIPGGFSPDYMRRCQATVDFVREMDKQGKLVAGICHGPWLIASACQIKGKDITAYHSIKDDLINAGANYLDQEVVVAGNIVTSRTPKDLAAFMKAIIEKIG